MDFKNELSIFLNEFNEKPYKYVINFHENFDKNYKNYIENLEKTKKEFEELAKKYRELRNKKKEEEIVKKIVSSKKIKIENIEFTLPVISSPEEAFNFPHRLCFYQKDIYLVAFPELKQILPLTNITQIFTDFDDPHFTKVNNNITLKNLEKSEIQDFAVFPYSRDTWQIFMKNTNWKYFKPLNIYNVNKKKFPIKSTAGISEIAKTIKPYEMAPLWSLFGQLYFMLLLFSKSAGQEHFFPF